MKEHRFSGKAARMDSNVWSVFVDVPDDIVQDFKALKIKRFICTYNDKVSKHCAILSHGDGRYFVMLNKEECKKLGADIGSEVEVHLKADTSKYGMPMPDEMAELLRQDPDADTFFHSLSPGKQRSILFIVGKPKGSDTRLRKAIAICEYLKSVEGKLDFREMNQAIKDSRFRL